MLSKYFFFNLKTLCSTCLSDKQSIAEIGNQPAATGILEEDLSAEQVATNVERLDDDVDVVDPLVPEVEEEEAVIVEEVEVVEEAVALKH